MPGIFISYRREDAAGWAGRLTESLRRRFPKEQVFQDIAAITVGEDFVAAIERALAACNVVLVLIGPNWLRAENAAGLRRLDDENDFVRLEVARALPRTDLKVIPVLVGGARMPRAEELPADLAALTRRHAFELSDTRWDYDVGQLAGQLAPLAAESRPWRGTRVATVAAGACALIAGAWYLLAPHGGVERAAPPAAFPLPNAPAQKGAGPEASGGATPYAGKPVPQASGPVPAEKGRSDPASAVKAGATFRDCAECPEMVVLPPGEFMMGSSRKDDRHESNELPRHPVKIAYRLAVGKFEVTRGQFAAFAKATGYESRAYCSAQDGRGEFKLGWEDPALEQDASHPVVCVSWTDAQAYVKWLSAKTGKPYRLLSEAEWEYAARGGTGSPFYWAAAYAEGVNSICGRENVEDQSLAARLGDTFSGRQVRESGAACSDGHAFTAPVGKYPPNPFGLHDMGGNVSEWVIDCYSGYTEAAGNGAPVRPLPGECGHRALRGGSWWGEAAQARPARRTGLNASAAYPSLGFRVAREF